MRSTASGNAETAVANGTTSGSYSSGWLFHFVQEGWLRKRWRRRWCVLKEEKILLYEDQPGSEDDKVYCIIQLENFEKCAQLPKKECKKTPHAFSLELRATPERKSAPKNKAAPKRELFYAEDQLNQDKWMKELNEKITVEKLCDAKPLNHVTKARPKPSHQRRPPTRQHLRERAQQSEVTLDIENEVKTAQPKRGHVPKEALKPLSPMGRTLKPNISSNLSPNRKSDTNLQSVDGSSPTSKIPPQLPLKPKNTNNEKDEANDDVSKPTNPPAIPPQTLKPKVMPISEEEVVEEENKISENQPDSGNDLGSYGNESSPTSKIPPQLPLKPKNTTNANDEANDDISKPTTPPKIPPQALKPKVMPISEEEVVKEDNEHSQSYPDPENDLGSDGNESSPTSKIPPQLPLKPKNTNNAKAEGNDDVSKSTTPPEISPQTLKPKVMPISEEEVVEEDNEHSQSHPDSGNDLGSDGNESSPTSKIPPQLPLKPKNTNNAKDEGNDDVSKPTTPPEIPPQTLKPKAMPISEKEVVEEDNEHSQSHPDSGNDLGSDGNETVDQQPMSCEENGCSKDNGKLRANGSVVNANDGESPSSDGGGAEKNSSFEENVQFDAEPHKPSHQSEESGTVSEVDLEAVKSVSASMEENSDPIETANEIAKHTMQKEPKIKESVAAEDCADIQ